MNDETGREIAATYARHLHDIETAESAMIDARQQAGRVFPGTLDESDDSLNVLCEFRAELERIFDGRKPGRSARELFDSDLAELGRRIERLKSAGYYSRVEPSFLCRPFEAAATDRWWTDDRRWCFFIAHRDGLLRVDQRWKREDGSRLLAHLKRLGVELPSDGRGEFVAFPAGERLHAEYDHNGRRHETREWEFALRGQYTDAEPIIDSTNRVRRHIQEQEQARERERAEAEQAERERAEQEQAERRAALLAALADNETRATVRQLLAESAKGE